MPGDSSTSSAETAGATRPLLALSKEELEFFDANGYVGPFTVLDAEDSDELCGRLLRDVAKHRVLTGWTRRRQTLETVVRELVSTRHERAQPDGPLGAPTFWLKSAHLLVSEMANLATRSEILNRITSLLGEDVLLWGSQLVIKRHGETHRWHADVEHVRWDGVSAWVGLRNVGPDSTMKVVVASHRFDVTPQELGDAESGDLDTDHDVLRLASRFTADPQIVKLDLSPGEFFIFSGRTWHSSINQSGQTRGAAILQYCAPDARVRVPCSYHVPTRWYHRQPLVMLVSGADLVGVNHVTRHEELWPGGP